MPYKWIDVQVTNAVFKDMQKRYQEIPEKKAKEKKGKKDMPYLKIVITGKEPEKRFENFKKVKFPAFCIYGWHREKVGIINSAYLGGDDTVYELHDITEQHEGINRQSDFRSLKEMHKHYNIREIVRAKVILKRGK